jgi:hypothetical protein
MYREIIDAGALPYGSLCQPQTRITNGEPQRAGLQRAGLVQQARIKQGVDFQIGYGEKNFVDGQRLKNRSAGALRPGFL